MGPALDDEEVEAIIDAWKEMDEPSINKVSDKTDHSPATVKKYIDEWKGEEGSVSEDFEDPAGTASEGSDGGSLFKDQNAEMAGDFREFMKLLNDRMGFGLKEKAINMMAAEIEDYGELPTQSDVVSFLESTDSGIKNANELTWIGQRYNTWKQQYEQKRMMGDNMGGGMMGGPQGSMFGGGNQQNQQPGMMGPPNQNQQQGMGMAAQNPMMMMFQQMQQQMQEMQKQIQQSQQQNDGDILEQKSKQFLEAKFEELINAENQQEQDQVIQELRALRQQMQAGGEREQQALGDDWRMNLIKLAQTGQIDMGEAKDLLTEIGQVESDPRVLEKEYEKEMKEMELQQKTARAEKIADMGETMVERFGQSIGQAIVGGGGDESPTEQQSAEQTEQQHAEPEADHSHPQPAQQPSEPQQGGTCKHCGADLVHGQNTVACMECEWGVGPCDVCNHPVEIPPRGESDFKRCVECEGVIEVPDDPEAELECDDCGATPDLGPAEGELLKCDGCGNYRPIMRQEEVAQRQSQAQEILEADPDDVIANDTNGEAAAEEDMDIMGD